MGLEGGGKKKNHSGDKGQLGKNVGGKETKGPIETELSKPGRGQTRRRDHKTTEGGVAGDTSKKKVGQVATTKTGLGLGKQKKKPEKPQRYQKSGGG